MRVIFAGGGTGGHLFRWGIAELQQRDNDGNIVRRRSARPSSSTEIWPNDSVEDQGRYLSCWPGVFAASVPLTIIRNFRPDVSYRQVLRTFITCRKVSGSRDYGAESPTWFYQ
jgi:hypothetical protein